MLITVIGEQDEQIEVKPTMSENNIVTSLMHSGSTFSPVNNACKLYTLSVHLSLLSCQPRVTVTSRFVYKVIRDCVSIDHLCIYPIRRIGLIHK